MKIHFDPSPRDEGGEYTFWTVGDVTFRTQGNPEDRITAMVNDPRYCAFNPQGDVRPATSKEVAIWLAHHPNDAQYAELPEVFA